MFIRRNGAPAHKQYAFVRPLLGGMQEHFHLAWTFNPYLANDHLT